MKKILSLGLVVALMLGVGCEKKAQEEVVVPVIEETVVKTPTLEVESVKKLTEDDFKDFFTAYFSFTEEELIELNQNMLVVNEAYWNHLKDDYKPLIKERLGKFLSMGLNKRLETEYIKEDLVLPKMVAINNYIVDGSCKVQNIKMISTRELGENKVYEFEIITDNEVTLAADFLKSHTFNSEINYFQTATEGESQLIKSVLEDYDLDDYYNAQGYYYTKANQFGTKDHIKLLQKYWVQIAEEDGGIKIESVTAAEPYKVSAMVNNLPKVSLNVSRLPYYEKASVNDTKLLNDVFKVLSDMKNNTYVNSEIAFDSGKVAYAEFWKSMGLEDKLMIDEDYAYTFPKTINPYKDNIVKITPQLNEMKIVPSIYSTKEQPVYIVNLPIQALLSNNQIVYYNYKYFVGLESGKVEYIQYMAMEVIDELVFNDGFPEREEVTSEEQNATERQENASTETLVNTEVKQGS